MTKTNVLFLLVIFVCSCGQKAPEQSEPRPPTKDEIRAYMLEESSKKELIESDRRRKERDMEDLRVEMITLSGRIQEKKSALERDNRRLFRRILTDTAYQWVRDNERDKSRVREIQRELERLGY